MIINMVVYLLEETEENHENINYCILLGYDTEYFGMYVRMFRSILYTPSSG
jgi:hypothetical protein